ncbi:MAG: ATP-grasp domain-containing protein [Spirochaetaceae bacterium]
MSTSVLILGGGTMQLPAIQTALSRKWTVSVADGNPDAPGAGLCHHFIHVDLRDLDGLIEAAGRIKDSYGLDGVFTAGTDFSFAVAKIAEAHDLPGMSPETAKGASDKVRMRRIFAQKGVPAPSFVQILPEEGVRERTRELSFPLVVKPVDNMGSRGVRRVETCVELEEAAEEARRSSFSGNVIVEEYIDGSEFSIDALVEGGEIRITGFADRIIRFSPYFVEMGHTLPSVVEPSLQEAVESTFKRAVSALGITEGAAKGDVKWNGKEAVVGEVAARLSGGYMSGWTFPYATGVDLTGAALNISVGLPAGNLDPVVKRVSAERAFISIPGTVAALEGRDKARAMSGVKKLFVRVSPGEEVRFPTNNVEKCGNIIAVDESRERACQRAEKAARQVWVRLEPEEEITERFLYKKEEGWIEDAFTLNVPENYRYYKEMEPLKILHGSPFSRGTGKYDGSKSKGVGFVSAENGPEILVYPLPKLHLENTLDWHGTSLAQSAERALSHTSARFIEGEDGENSLRTGAVILGSVFWTALLRGGLQGAVWCVETVRRIVERGEDPCAWGERIEVPECSGIVPNREPG